ncbi:hypothetical protein M8C21_030487 [Ambrosia artemisiifolia]|uniref:Cyclin-B3-1 n=1 Tax=Ambrosia artemisiifolia TaxID=4212 RepID=A0AAD5BR55_AMBAR|nr:hypothetical protein M8C21_030487 [Ambrosia artemisiifolia]
MVLVKGLSNVKSRDSGERVTRNTETGGGRSLKVYTEDDMVATKAKRKSIPVKAETSHINARSQKAHHQSLKNYMEIQTDITPQMRGIIINWLIEVHLKFDLMQETLYLMVTLLDYYLSAVSIKKNEMQLVGLTSLLLASKYEDFWHPKVMELISISAEVYTRDQMLGMETTILKKLNFRLNLPTPYVFMLRFLRAAQGGKKFENIAFFLIELCLVEYDALHYKPSLLCASAIYVARCTLHLTPAWTPLLSKHSHYEEVQIRDCAEMILGFHQAARTTILRVTYDKFKSADRYQVALTKPLDRLPPL